MASLSKIQNLMQWCFHPDENSKKYVKWAHPLFAFIFGTAAALIPMIKLTDFLEEKYPMLKGEFPEWTQKKLPMALALYMMILISSRVKYFGPIALYDFLWACNISLLLMIIGLVKKSHLLVSTSMILVSVDQILWYIDVVGYALFKKFYIGVAAFLKWPSTAFIKKITTTHHIWFIPLALSVLKTSNNISYASYGCSFFLSTILVALGRVLAPKYFTIRMNGKEEKLYANLNLAWELWKDVKLPILSKYEHQIKKSFCLYAILHSMIWNGGNLLFFSLLRGLLKLINK